MNDKVILCHSCEKVISSEYIGCAYCGDFSPRSLKSKGIFSSIKNTPVSSIGISLLFSLFIVSTIKIFSNINF